MNRYESEEGERTNAIHIAYKSNALLGEGARWCEEAKLLYWVDILGCQLHSFCPATGVNKTWRTPSKIGCSAGIDKNSRLLALEDGLYKIDLTSSEISLLHKIAHPSPSHRLNDGYVDPVGRFWVGSMNEAGKSDGSLYCFHDISSEPVVHGSSWGCLNGIGWSPAGDSMYVTDSKSKTIWTYNYDVATGEIGDKRILVCFDSGVPDGLTVDKEGSIWIAMWDGWTVVKLTPNGKILKKIKIPVKRPTSLAFGGADGAVLFITSASVNVPPSEQLLPPLDGSLFFLEMNEFGTAERRVSLQ